MDTPLTRDQIEALRDALTPIWARHGSGLGLGICAFCGGFLVSEYGVRYPNPHRDRCGYLVLCSLLGLAP